MTRPLSQLHCYPAAGPEADPRLADVDHLEWLETDGLSGYACSTVTMCPSRRYHGLLCAPVPGTARRHLFLAGLVDAVVAGGATLTLSSPRLGGEVSRVPARQVSFAMAPWPTATYQVGGVEIRREVLMPRGRHAVLVRYTVVEGARGGSAVGLVLRPLVAFREADQLTFRNDVLRETAEVRPRGIRLRCYDALPTLALTLAVPGGGDWQYAPAPEWWCGVEYAIDLERGYGGHEDLFCPGALAVSLRAGQSLVLAASLDDEIEQPAVLWDAESERRRAAVPATRDLQARCALAADDFLYTGPGGRRGILAGFPWFDEWGRDTFIALPGLTCARGDLDGCAEVLSGARQYLRDGLLPNIFGATIADSHYGSVDAALWFARAVQQVSRAGGDQERVLEEYYPALLEIADAYRAGTAPRVAAMGIRGDDAGLLVAGTPELNPTWMDASPSSGPVTPRHGSPVEICALWYSLLAQLGDLAGQRGDTAAEERFQAATARAGAAFLDRFWSAERGYLADVWGPAAVDDSLRPNMVLAAALELSPLAREQRAAVVAAAERALLTPYGLRTLAPDDPAYVPHYRGGPEERDAAYHQGTVWPWLFGSYVEAALRAAADPFDPDLRARLRSGLDRFATELDHGGLEHIHEVYDGDPPHRRGGTFAQAWSTAEVLRALALLDGTMPL